VAVAPTTLRSELDGLSKLIWLVEDGAPVEADDVLARFDTSHLQEQLLTCRRDLRLAEAEIAALVEAKQPLALQGLERELGRAITELTQQTALLEQFRPLVKEALLAPEEMQKQQALVSEWEATRDTLHERIRLTRDILHPAEKEQAQARLETAQQELDQLESRLQQTEVRAPTRGIVHLPRVRIDGEKRPVRVGDGLFKNQAYLYLADLTRLMVQAQLDEHHLYAVAPGQPVEIRLAAFPQRGYAGTVHKIGTRPLEGGTRYRIEIHFNEPVTDLQPGLTAELNIQIAHLDDALLLPRQALLPSHLAPTVRLASPGDPLREIQTGPANPREVVVLKGLEAGDRVRIP
jgi:multidrug efflux pump subunit AcrA (membrane-fusion protein)